MKDSLPSKVMFRLTIFAAALMLANAKIASDFDYTKSVVIKYDAEKSVCSFQHPKNKSHFRQLTGGNDAYKALMDPAKLNDRGTGLCKIPEDVVGGKKGSYFLPAQDYQFTFLGECKNKKTGEICQNKFLGEYDSETGRRSPKDPHKCAKLAETQPDCRYYPIYEEKKWQGEEGKPGMLETHPNSPFGGKDTNYKKDHIRCCLVFPIVNKFDGVWRDRGSISMNNVRRINTDKLQGVVIAKDDSTKGTYTEKSSGKQHPVRIEGGKLIMNYDGVEYTGTGFRLKGQTCGSNVSTAGPNSCWSSTAGKIKWSDGDVWHSLVPAGNFDKMTYPLDGKDDL